MRVTISSESYRTHSHIIKKNISGPAFTSGPMPYLNYLKNTTEQMKDIPRPNYDEFGCYPSNTKNRMKLKPH